MNRIASLSSAAALVAALAAPLAPVHAQSLPRTELQVVGSISSLAVYREFEQRLWNETLPQKSGGAIKAELKGFNEMGLKGPEVLRLMSQGVIPIGATVMFYLASDDPAIEAVDIAGMAPDIDTARRITQASKSFYETLLRQRFGVKLFGIGTYPAQVAYCNGEIRGLADLKGKKVRVGGRSQSELMQAIGATPVTIAFGEVVPALQNRTVDCAITGTLSGNAAKWHEVTTHLYALPLSWGQIAYAANLNAWNKLDPQVRALIEGEMRRLEDEVWNAAELHTQQGLLCNGGDPGCTLGTPGKMTVVQANEADRALLARLVQEQMLPRWAQRCGKDCVVRFNETIGRAVGIEAAAQR